jgi:hypothetical protein
VAAFPALYVELGDVLLPGSTSGPKVTGTRTPPIPARLEALNLRGRGASTAVSRWLLEQRGRPTEHLVDQYGALPMVAILGELEADVRATLGLSRAVFHGSTEQTVTAITRFLLAQLDSVCDRHPAVAEFAYDVRTLHHECKRTISEQPHRLKVGPCPMELDDGTVCGTARSVDPKGDSMRCGGCGTTWQRWEWMALASTIDAA